MIKSRSKVWLLLSVSLEKGMREFILWTNDQRKMKQYQKTIVELKTFGHFGRSQPSDKP